MKPPFNFLDLLPFQLLGGVGIAVGLLGLAAGGAWSAVWIAVAAFFVFAALRSVPMR
jgi:hypothetical protein